VLVSASSPISLVLDQLADLARWDAELQADPVLLASSLLERLSQVPEPRGRRGLRHPLPAVLVLCACAPLSTPRPRQCCPGSPWTAKRCAGHAPAVGQGLRPGAADGHRHRLRARRRRRGRPGPRPARAAHPAHRPADDALFPGARQVFRLRRDTGEPHGPWTGKETMFGVTSLLADLAGPASITSANIVSATQSFYDDTTFSGTQPATPTRGEVTMTRPTWRSTCRGWTWFKGRENVFVVPNDGPLDLTGCIVSWG
jgi:hypothetical protein